MNTNSELTEIKRIVQENSDILHQHTDMLQRYGEILYQHTDMLQRHSEVLQQYSDLTEFCINSILGWVIGRLYFGFTQTIRQPLNVADLTHKKLKRLTDLNRFNPIRFD